MRSLDNASLLRCRRVSPSPDSVPTPSSHLIYPALPPVEEEQPEEICSRTEGWLGGPETPPPTAREPASHEEPAKCSASGSPEGPTPEQLEELAKLAFKAPPPRRSGTDLASSQDNAISKCQPMAEDRLLIEYLASSQDNVVPQPHDMLHDLGWMDWPNMLKDERLHRREHAMVSIMPTFYMDEADANKFDRPRLDFVVSFDDGQAVRYHPGVVSIWLPANPNGATNVKRRAQLQQLRRKFGRDWQR